MTHWKKSDAWKTREVEGREGKPGGWRWPERKHQNWANSKRQVRDWVGLAFLGPWDLKESDIQGS